MTDYVEILDTQLDPDAPITSGLGYQIRDNPIALAEGAESAPKISPVALSGVYIGFLQQTGTTENGFGGLDRHKKILMSGTIRGSSSPSANSVQIRYSNDNGSTWGSYQSFFSPPQDKFCFFSGHFDLEDGRVNIVALITTPSVSTVATTLTVPSDVNAFAIRCQQGDMNFNAIVTAVEGVSP